VTDLRITATTPEPLAVLHEGVDLALSDIDPLFHGDVEERHRVGTRQRGGERAGGGHVAVNQRRLIDEVIRRRHANAARKTHRVRARVAVAQFQVRGLLPVNCDLGVCHFLLV